LPDPSALTKAYLSQVGRTGSERIGRQRVSLTVLTGLMWRLGWPACGCKCHRRVARKVDQKRMAKCFALGFALIDAMGTWQVGAPQAESQCVALRKEATEVVLWGVAGFRGDFRF